MQDAGSTTPRDANTASAPETKDSAADRPAVLVLGGGIAGIQAALNLAEFGVKVHLVEESSSLGGIMARLNKTFPTNDCSICIEAPVMYEVTKNPNIDLLTYTELRRVSGNNGKYRVRLRKKPRFVLEDKCKGCGKCVDVCPVALPDELDGKLGGKRTLISIPMQQAVPNVYYIANSCRFGQMRDKGACIGDCKIDCIQCRECPIARCVVECKKEGADAIVLWQRDEQVDLEVSSIIVAVGLEPLPPEQDLYGYGTCENVLTHLEYERLTNAGGPSAGELHRLSDDEPPKAVAWIQCAGRDAHKGLTYCSKVCCMAATKQALITKEHDKNIETYIFYTDLQAFGKGFHEFFNRAEAEGVHYIRGKPAEVREDPKTKQVILKYEDISGSEVKELAVDMLVLSMALVPPERIKKLAKILKLELDGNGFLKVKDPILAPAETGVPGIYICGGAGGPADISESVTQALAASSRAVINAKSQR